MSFIFMWALYSEDGINYSVSYRYIKYIISEYMQAYPSIVEGEIQTQNYSIIEPSYAQYIGSLCPTSKRTLITEKHVECSPIGNGTITGIYQSGPCCEYTIDNTRPLLH